MIKKIYNICLFFCLFWGWQACSDSETLTPTDKEDMWQFAKIKEGNEPYDQYIKAFYDSTNIVILYEWDKNTAFWNGSGEWKGLLPTETELDTSVYIINTKTGNSEKVQTIDTNGDGVPDEVYANFNRYVIGHQVLPHHRWADDDWDNIAEALERTVSITGTEVGDSIIVVDKKLKNGADYGLHMTPSDKDYISKQLELLEDVFFQYYPADFLKKHMAPRILLGQGLYQYRTNYFEVPFFYNMFSLLVNWGDETLDNMDQDLVKYMRFYINLWFMKYRFWSPIVDSNETPSIFDEFYAVSGEEAYINYPSNYNEAGFTSSLSGNKNSDLTDYFKVLCQTSLEQFLGNETGGYRNGLGRYEKCLKKYKILREVLINQGVDIDAIREDGASATYYRDGKTYKSYYSEDFYTYFSYD